MIELHVLRTPVLLSEALRAHSLRERALPTLTKVESGTSQIRSGASVNLSNSGINPEMALMFEIKMPPVLPEGGLHLGTPSM